ncbi:MAG TPA: c-type cytochrome [Caulobacteraceae bacterium]|nr:c-type cytochrome [Caulobacteraceae bacterium]
MALAVLASGFSVAATARPHPTSTAAVREGEHVALVVCAYCHVVPANLPAQPILNQPTRSFQDVADDPKTTAKSLRRFITTAHWDVYTVPMTMPDPQLLDQQYDDVVAYILSLRRRQQAAPPRGGGGTASESGDAGEEVALRRCSICHVVTADPRYRPALNPPGPSFQTIAADPQTTAESLRRFIATTHWDEQTTPMTMPAQNLRSDEIDSVVSYILNKRESR